MPKVNGYQVIEALRELPLRPAVIVLTAQGARQMQDVAGVTVVHAVKVKRPSDALGRDTVAVERDMDGCCAPLLLRDTTGTAKC